VSTSVVLWSKGLSKSVPNIITSYIDYMRFVAFMTVRFIKFFHILFSLFYFISLYIWLCVLYASV